MVETGTGCGCAIAARSATTSTEDAGRSRNIPLDAWTGVGVWIDIRNWLAAIHGLDTGNCGDWNWCGMRIDYFQSLPEKSARYIIQFVASCVKKKIQETFNGQNKLRIRHSKDSEVFVSRHEIMCRVLSYER